jgi:predicted O-methyltransferase YrrM
MPSTQLEKSRKEFIKRFRRIEMNTTPGDAALLRILIECSRARRGLEIGTATGYGAMLMGLGFEKNGGRLTSIDPDSRMVKTARENIRKMKLQETVGFIEGDALAVIPTLKGKFDFVFIDAIKGDYLKYLRAVEPKLKPGAIVVADNVIQFAKQMKGFLDAVANEPQYRTVMVMASKEKEDGMTVSYRS